MQDVIIDHVAVVKQFAKAARDRRGRHLKGVIKGLGGAQVMGGRTHSADAAGDLGHVNGGAALGEFFEPAQLGHLEPGVFHIAGVVQKDFDLSVPLEPGHRIYDNRVMHGLSSFG